MEAGLVHQGQQSKGPQRDGLATGIRAGHHQCAIAVPKPDVDGHHAPGQAGMSGAEEDDLGPLHGFRTDAVHVRREPCLGGPEIEARECRERLPEWFRVGCHQRR